MTYGAFHLVFTIPPIILLAWKLPVSLRDFEGWRAQIALPLIAGIAFVYTTPWDNYLVEREVWWYGVDRVIGTLGAVPVEEYGFFLLQPMLTGLFCFHCLMRASVNSEKVSSSSAPSWTGFAFFAMMTAIGFGLINGSDQELYMGLTLAWAPPLLAGMWLYDGETLWKYRRPLIVAVGIPTLYLWIIDGIAIRLGIWTISDQYTLGLSFLGLPVEEATFFLVTNLLVVKGILLLLYGNHEPLETGPVAGQVATGAGAK